MFQPEDNLSGDLNPDLNSEKNSEKNLDNVDANVSPKNVAQRKQQLQKMFTKLIIFGLAFGAVLGVGAYFLINKLGLNKKPYQIERERIEQQQTFLNETSSFFRIGDRHV